MKEIPLTNSEQKAIVDDEDLDRCLLHNWYTNGPGYVMTTIKGKTVFLHSFVMGAKEGEEIDHKFQDKFDCRKEFLRLCTHSQNCANDGPRSNNKLGVKGVDWYERSKKYRATIRVNYKKIHLGLFDSAREAAAIYNYWSKKYFGEFGYQNDLEAIQC
jgi:hypothetical protein